MGRVLIGSGLIIAIVLLFAVNIFAGTVFSGWRLDLTEHRSFTLSDGTKNTLRALEEPVTLRLYLSQKLATRLPAVASYTHRVREMLEEYEHVAGGKLVLSVIDRSQPFSEAEDRAVGYGLSGIPLQDGESIFYFGLVGTNALDAQEVALSVANHTTLPNSFTPSERSPPPHICRSPTGVVFNSPFFTLKGEPGEVIQAQRVER